MQTKEALSAAISALYFDDNSDYGTALWQIVLALGGQEAVDLLEDNPNAAYNKYAVVNVTTPSKKVIPIVAIK